MMRAIWDAITMFRDAELDGDELRMHYAAEHLSFLADLLRITSMELER